MNSQRLHLAFVITLSLLIVSLLGGTYGANKLLTSKGNTLTNLKAKSQALAEQQLALAQAKKDVARYAGLRDIAKAVVPEDKNQAEAVREIVNIAGSNNVSLAEITFPSSTLGNSSSSSSAGNANVNSSNNKLSQVKAVKGIPGVYVLPITMQSNTDQPVQYNRFINFLSGLERNRRTAQVSSISIEPDADNPNYLNFTLTVNEYIKP